MYTSIVGLVMLAAILEWFLWIAAFVYCLWKVFLKAEHWTIRILAVVLGILFTCFRWVALHHIDQEQRFTLTNYCVGRSFFPS